MLDVFKLTSSWLKQKNTKKQKIHEKQGNNFYEHIAMINQSHYRPDNSYLFLLLKYFNQDVQTHLGIEKQKTFNPGAEIQFLIDSGASISVMNYTTFLLLKSINPKLHLRRTPIQLRGANENNINLLG